MSTNNNNGINQKKRIFGIACRENTAILTDSKNFTLKKFTAPTGQIACMKALNDMLTRMPQGVKFDYAVSVLIPEPIACLAYEDTRNYWLSHGVKKNGDKISPELLEEIKTANKLIKVHGSNLQVFTQRRITSPYYKSFVRATWRAMDGVIAPAKVETVNAVDFA